MAAVQTAQPLSAPDEQLKAAQEAVSQFDFIRFTVVDVNGVPRGVLLPADVAARSLKAGIGCPIGKLSPMLLAFTIFLFRLSHIMYQTSTKYNL